MTTGSCHCKSVAFEVDESLLRVRYCYCETCRKLSGAAFSVVAKVSVNNFRITKGRDALVRYESRPGKSRYYCASCYSPVYVAVESDVTSVRIRLGLLDDSPNVEVTAHVWVSEKPAWHEINDDLPRYQNEYTG
jgi:hypothetical protein